VLDAKGGRAWKRFDTFLPYRPEWGVQGRFDPFATLPANDPYLRDPAVRRNGMDSEGTTVGAASRHIAGTRHAMVYLWASALSAARGANARARDGHGDELQFETLAPFS
jgi:hypothetical protein